jgi:NAD(P)-dependent dehydrogenase (short-subunit alcohol dehydrogenase family)
MKNVLITGASSGIGIAIAEKLIAEGGYKIISISRDPEKVKREFSKLASKKDKIDFFFGDVSDPASCNAIFEHLNQNYDSLHGLVNNAGVLIKGGIENTSLYQWEKVLSVNLTAPFLLVSTLLPLLKRAGNSSIVNISSIAAAKPGTSIAYSVSKAGLDMLTKYLAGDLAEYRIRVNSVNPGLVRTNIHLDNKIVENKQQYETMIQASLPRYPSGRIGEPEDIAEMVVFLLSGRSSWITGSIITLDGGASIYNELLPPKRAII